MTTPSMDSYVSVVSPFLAAPLVDDVARSRLFAVAGLLPPCSLAGLELRLRDVQPTVDFFVRLPYTRPSFDPLLLTHPVWQAVARLCDDIVDPSGTLHAHVARVFTEFDLGADPPTIPVPGLFLQLHEGKVRSASDVLAMVEPLVVCDGSAGVQRAALDCCVTALPTGVALAHLGVMLSRPGAPLRLVIHGVRSADIPDCLGRIGWHDPAHQFAPLIAGIAPYADAVVMLDIDVADEVRPKVGVEFYVRQEADNRERWQTLLGVLVDRGLAGPRKAAAILGWPGVTQEPDDGRPWPETLALGDRLLRGMGASAFWRNINHVKIAYQPGHEAEAKIYLGFGHNWFPKPATSRPV
jgi:hypothetical protein